MLQFFTADNTGLFLEYTLIKCINHEMANDGFVIDVIETVQRLFVVQTQE